MKIEAIKLQIEKLNLHHVFFWWTLEGQGVEIMCQNLSSYDKTAIMAIADSTGFDYNWTYQNDESAEKTYFISFF